MAEWKYKARDSRGKPVEGVLSAETRNDATKALRSKRLRPIYIKENSDSYFSRIIVKDKNGKTHLQLGGGLPSVRELSVFTKQCSIMIERGVPLIQALSILASNQKSISFAAIIEQVKTLVENGSTLSNALGRFPRVFDELYVAMVRSGEVSGNLDTVLREIVKFLEKSAKLRSQLRSASIYPGMIVLVATAITWGILVFLVPVFTKQFTDSGKQLPEITQLLVDISSFLKNNALYIVGCAAGLVTAFNYYRKTPEGKVKVDAYMLRAPIIGNVVRKVAIGRFTSTLSTMLISGVSIIDALTICAQSAGNKFIENFVTRVKQRISEGSTFADPLSEGGLFPNMVVSMVAIGEQTGALDQTLAKVSEIYEEEVDVAVKAMTDSLQPILIITIGVILGFVVIALYMPILDGASLAG